MHTKSTISSWVGRFAAALPAGPVLDVACGGGRHLRHFHGLGHPVTGVDRELSGVADLAGTAGVELIQADLEAGGPWPLGARQFAGVVVTNYLWRPLLAALAGAVAPGGWLLYETFARGHERHGRPQNPDFLLLPGELLEAVRGQLMVVAYENGLIERPRPAVVQRIAAIRPGPLGVSESARIML
ncbi:MAG: class I SAM-dependent methyltransferase [Proteobacteria bacterium]|nr:class I SAM-dependent methyltransferase [Pseudomonadota bacterium]